MHTKKLLEFSQKTYWYYFMLSWLPSIIFIPFNAWVIAISSIITIPVFSYLYFLTWIEISCYVKDNYNTFYQKNLGYQDIFGIRPLAITFFFRRQIYIQTGM